MKEVKISKLEDLKSVFDNADTNIFHFENLKTSFNTNPNNVRLAQPQLKARNNTIVWLSDFVQDGLFQFDELTDSERLKLLDKVKASFEWFKQNKKALSNDFYDNIIEIPSTNSIYLSKGIEEDIIIIAEWGFLEDRIDVNKGILKKLFPASKVSILVVVEDSFGVSIKDLKVSLKNFEETFHDYTDSLGKARLGAIRQSSTFTIYSEDNNFESIQFTADGRDVYKVIVKNKIDNNDPKINVA